MSLHLSAGPTCVLYLASLRLSVQGRWTGRQTVRPLTEAEQTEIEFKQLCYWSWDFGVSDSLSTCETKSEMDSSDSVFQNLYVVKECLREAVTTEHVLVRCPSATIFLSFL